MSSIATDVQATNRQWGSSDAPASSPRLTDARFLLHVRDFGGREACCRSVCEGDDLRAWPFFEGAVVADADLLEAFGAPALR